MKHWITSILLGSALLLVTNAASAQTLKANVPFDFRIPGGTLKAGEYTVSQTASAGTITYKVYSAEQKRGGLVVTSGQSAGMLKADQAKLVFACQGEECHLAEIWAPGNGAARTVAAMRFRHGDEHVRLAMVPLIREQ